MDIENSADNTELLNERAKAEALERDIVPFLGRTALEGVKAIPIIGQLVAAGEELRQKREQENMAKSLEELELLAKEQGSKRSSVKHDYEKLAGLRRSGRLSSVGS